MLEDVKTEYLRSYQHNPVKIIRLPILDCRTHYNQSEEENRCFKNVKIKSKGLLEKPAKKNQERKDEHCDLQNTVDNGSHNKVHLGSSSHGCYSESPGRIADRRYEDQADECFVDI